MALTNNDSQGIKISAVNHLFGFSALRFTIEDLDEGEKKSGMHYHELTPRDFIDLNIDYAQMGVAGDNSWGAQPLDKYQIKPKDYEYSFLISPIR